MNESDPQYDYLILGAGPAGLQLGHYLEKAGRDYLILEAGEGPGTFFKEMPRHRTLISSNKVHTGYEDPEINLRWDWNSLLSDDPELLFKHYSREYFPHADALVRYLGDFAERLGLKVRYRTRVTEVSKNGCFRAVDEAGKAWTSRRLIVATGLKQPYLPPIPGIELTENYADVPVDPEDFANQKVLIIGKGNSGFETADNLISTTALIHVVSPSPLNLAWKSHFVGHLRAVNNNFLDTYQLKSQNAVLDGTLRRIERVADGRYKVYIDYTHADEESEDLLYDRVITCTGFRFDAEAFDSNCRPKLCIFDRLPEQTSSWESTNVEDLYFAGVLMQMRDYKKTTSGFIHGFRYNIRSLHHIFEARYHGREWPSVRLGASPEDLARALLERINQSSALWQQFGFLGDLITVPEGSDEARYYEELPVDYIHQAGRASPSPLAPDNDGHDWYVLTLEFGKVVGDPFNIQRKPEPAHAQRSTFLHPVIRHYHGGEKLSELHLLENLLGEWRDRDLHVEPLLDYLRAESRCDARARAVALG